jgi:nitroreductase
MSSLLEEGSVMFLGKPITAIVEQRFSCRTYLDTPIEPPTREQLEQFVRSPGTGPFGTPARFRLVAATDDDSSALRGLGTYGFIRGATGFIAGVVSEGDRNLEDFGYRLEEIILFATALGLGTCWLGGTFNRSRFAAVMGIRDGELLPAVAAVGHISDRRSLRDRLIRRQAAGATRFSWEQLFFDRQFGAPLSPEAAGAYAVPLEMVRLGPSASNKQPWRIIKEGTGWHFYVQRTRAYRERNSLLQVADMQRIDIGIVMSHFELAAKELGLDGRWTIAEPEIARPDDLTEYSASWMADAHDPRSG